MIVERSEQMGGVGAIWELRVSQSYRVTDEKIPGGIFLRRVGTYDILHHS